MKLLLAGMRGTGKSTIALSMADALTVMRSDLSIGCHELDPYSDTHRLIRGQITSEERKGLIKCDFERVLVEKHLMPFKRDPSDIAIGDLPGKLTNPRMGEMMAYGTHAIVVGRYPVEKDSTGRHAKHHRTVEDWMEWLARRDIPVIARVHSLLQGQDPWPGYTPVYGLQRELVTTSTAIQQLAQQVLDVFDQNRGQNQLSLAS